MPYIKAGDRPRVEAGDARTPGELNYRITLALIRTWRSARSGLADEVDRCMREYLNGGGQLSYGAVNDCVGAAWCAVEEFRRRMGGVPLEMRRAVEQAVEALYYDLAAPYEDGKIVENGDVEGYPPGTGLQR